MRHRRPKGDVPLPEQNQSLQTLALHPSAKQLEVGDPLAEALVLSTSFKMASEAGFSAASLGEDPPPIYARWGNPTVSALERKLSALEGAEDAVCFGSGMAAVSALLHSLLRPGDHLVASNICYAGVAELVHDLIQRGIEASFVDTSDIHAVKAAITEQTKLVFVETPANPILRLTDIRAVADCAAKVGALLAVDSTFATPVATRPLEYGADFVVHSLTKYACGHGDALGGAVLGSRKRVQELRSFALVHHGAVLHPFAAWLIDRSLQTLPLRMRQHQENALAVAHFLERHPAVEQVVYPGLASHPQHELARRQMANFSGMIAFRTRNAKAIAQRLASDARILTYAVSLGKTKSLIVLVDTDEVQNCSFRLPPAELEKYRAVAGDGIFRLSVGLEDPTDIIAELDQILSR